MSWFDRLRAPKIKIKGPISNKKIVPEGLWRKCLGCSDVLYASDLKHNLNVCPKCGHHMPIAARARLESFFDRGIFHELGQDVASIDHLKFRDRRKYRDRLIEAKKNTGETEALIAAEGFLEQIPIVAVSFEFQYMGGSMGSVVGERFVRAVERSLRRGAPLICFTASGGARMQEGITSLMQMAKVSASLNRLQAANTPYFSILANPTMGGVSASFGMLGDFVFAEPDALIGFAGPRVIEQTVREQLPEGFQKSEFIFGNGAIDRIVDRREIRKLIHSLIITLGFGRDSVPKSELLPNEL